MSLYDDLLAAEDAPALDDLDEPTRFAGIPQTVLAELGSSANPDTLTERELEEFEAHVIEVSRIDPATFIQFAFGWPMQECHCEWQDLVTQHRKLVLHAPVEHGKTNQLMVARTVWELGVNPSIRIALIGNTEKQPIKCFTVIKQHLERNSRIQAVFPYLKRETRKGRPHLWHDDKITVQREDIDLLDPSIQGLGIYGNILGSRVDLALLDDVLDMLNTLHQTARDRTVDWFDAHVESRLSPMGRVVIMGQAWHRDDLMHVLKQRKGWHHERYDATTRELWPELCSISGRLCGWPKERLEQKRQEIPALQFNMQFRCLPMSEDSEIFNAKAIEQCFDKSEWDPTIDPASEFYCGVDLSIERGATNDRTSFFIGRLEGGVKTVQRIICGKMNLTDILYWFLFIEARYHPVLFLVENNAAQDYVVQWFKPDTITRIFEAKGEDPTSYLSNLPRVKGFTTGANKMDPKLGIWGMTIEFEQRRWRIPDHKLTREWKSEMLDFDPHAHTGDILMSSWLFHSAASKFRPRRIRSALISSAT